MVDFIIFYVGKGTSYKAYFDEAEAAAKLNVLEHDF